MHTLLTLAVAGSLLTGAAVAPAAADMSANTSAQAEVRMEVQSDGFVQERSHAATATAETQAEVEGEFHILPALLKADANTEVKADANTDARVDAQANLWTRITAGIKSFFASIAHSLNANADIKTEADVQVK